MRVDQLGLLLWKNYVVRKRQPGILALVFVWPIFVFMILYTVRDNVDLEYYPTCQFPARLMPQDGLLPFVQSFICSVGNPCDPLEEYEEVPSYRNATLGALVVDLQPMLGNETILSAVETLPKSIQLLKSMAQILTQPEIKALFDRGIRLGDLFKNHGEVKDFLKLQMPNAREGLVDGLFESSIKLLYLIEIFGSFNIDGVVCSPEVLRKYLIVSNEDDFLEISRVLCDVGSEKVPDILENLSKHLDFNGLLGMIDRAMAQFRDYDFFQDLRRAVITILDLNTIKKYVPEYLRLRQWLPKIIMVFRNVTFKEIDLTFVNKSIEVLDPVFSSEHDWPTFRQGLLRLNKTLALVKGMLHGDTVEFSDDIFGIIQHLKGVYRFFSPDSNEYENITRIVDLTFSILQDGAKITNRIIDRHIGEIELAAEVLDGVRDFLSDNILSSLSYMVSFTTSLVEMTHHVTVIHEQLLSRVYDISKNHQDLVIKMFATLDPNVYRSVVRAFSRLDFVERFVDGTRHTKPEELFCQNKTWNEIFDDFNGLEGQSKKVNELVCSDSGKKFISDIHQGLELNRFQRIVSDVLSTVISVAFGQPVKVEKSNVTSLVKSVKGFLSYFNTEDSKTLDWGIFQMNDTWEKLFEETQPQGRLNILGIHLSIAKMLGMRSLSYMTIRPDLENMDMLAGMILQDLRTNPTSWVADVRLHKSQLIESFYLTVTDREKTLKLLEYANFTRSYCTGLNPPALLNFPKSSNDTLLKGLICRLARSVQKDLELNITEIELEESSNGKRQSFNWTAFNEKAIDIYHYIDTLVHQEDDHYDPYKFQKLKNDFQISWTSNVTVKDAWEISVGLICKIFSVMESPVFHIQTKSDWKNMYAIAWASSVVFDNIERTIDQIQRNDNVAKLPEILQDMPQTEILTSAILRNLSPVILDIVDLITMKPIHLISVVDDYKSREKQWPCVQEESLGSAMELRNGTREIVREIERISCNPALFIREWREQPILMRVRKIHDETVKLPPFNWTFGYVTFRRVVGKFDHLINDAKEVVLEEDPKLSVYLKALATQVEDTFDDRLPDVIHDARNILDYVDMEMDKVLRVFGSNLTVSGLWTETVTTEERILVYLKFLSHVVHKTTEVASDALRDVTFSNSSTGSARISLFSLLGFDRKTAVAIFYNQLPYILSTFVNGLSDPVIDGRIFASFQNNTGITCSQLFEWWSDFAIGLTSEQYRTLKNFTCDLDPENFNAYTDLYMAETMIVRKPVNKYRSYIMTAFGDVYELAKLIKETARRNISVELPFSREYTTNFLKEFKDSLETLPNTEKSSNSSYEWTNYRLLMEGISEVFVHIANALRTVEVNDGRIDTWNLVEGGDVRQLLKILESHPEEAIALVASLASMNFTTNRFVPYESVRKTMCALHFNSSFWSTPNRTRFLMEVCHFDPRQLLKTVTSEEYVDALTGRTTALLRSTPLSFSLTKLADAVVNLTSTRPSVTLRSRVLDPTTWKSLSNETWTLIRKAEESLVHEYASLVGADGHNSRTADSTIVSMDFFTKTARFYQLLYSLTEVLSGGDVWQRLRVVYESSRVKPILTLMEDMPNLVISAVDTFVTSERLNDFVEKLFLGKLKPCDIDKYLIPPSFVRKRGLLASITNFCQKIVMSDMHLTFLDVLPLDSKYEESRITRNLSVDVISRPGKTDETYLLEKIDRFQTTVIRVAAEGFKDPKVPIWWTSFEEGTLKDFVSQYKKKDLRELAHLVVKKSSTLLRDLLNSVPDSENCTWCMSFPIEILNSQLSHHAQYSELICQLNNLNISEVHDKLQHDLYWNKTLSMIKNYKYLNTKKTVNEFVATLEVTLHYMADMIVDYHNDSYSQRVKDCFYKFVGGPSYSRPGLYITFLLGILDSIQKNVYVFDTATNHKKISRLTRLAERYVPIWKPLREVVHTSDAEDIDAFLPNALINVNMILSDRNYSLCRSRDECRNSTVLYNYLISKRAAKVIKYDQKSSKYPTVVEISKRLARSLDLDRVDRELRRWREEAAWDMTWLKEILRHLSAVIGEGGNLLDVASKMDFEDISNVLGMPDIVDGVVSILKDKTIDKLFNGMREVLEDVEPFISDREIINDLNSIVAALESMDIFKNLGLLDVQYVIKDMFDNWDVVRTYLVEKMGISNAVALTLSQSKVDMLSVFTKERRALNVKDTLCSTKKLGEMLNFENSQVTAEEVSSALCQLDDSQTQNVTITLIKNLNFDYIFKNLMTANVKNILANANLTEAEGKTVLDNLGVASELLPFFRDKLSARLSSEKLEEGDVEESEETISAGRFLQDSSEMLCGRRLVSDNSQFYKIISQIEDNTKGYDTRELESLPTDFCRDTYKSVLAMPGGKIIWSYVKPLLRGQILYSPNTTATAKIMTLANQTFAQMDSFSTLTDSFEKTLTSLANLSEMSDSLKDLESIISSDVMKIAIKSFGNGNFEGDFSELKLSEIAWRLKRSKTLISMVGMLNDLMDCVLMDRMRGFSTEDELEAEASNLMETREFLAGVVFLDQEPRKSRSLDHDLPENMTYKIRMDIDYVPSTKRLKTQFWIPGPESSFMEDLRYLRGFVQLQDSIDRAIMKLKTQREQNWRTVTQQMPYPCWTHAPFQSTLYESQGVQVCFFFALMMCVGSAVRHVVWERESRNSMVMSVMGLKPWRNTMAWFITSFIEVLIVMLSISVILLPGKILPRSEPSLILVLLIDYSFSIVTFCYMISTMFSSASLSAVTTVVMFLLTYMPYVIVIAMEAVLGLGYKLLICLSMSTSFCYGCLYAVRKEVQGVGLTWGAMWEESSPGDPMTLGLVLLMIAADGCLYGLIGYLVTRYTNSGRGFHGLRSRSLWWAKTRSIYGRPSYLAFVNNLYFTNDVLHPSTTYQDDESDASNLTVCEKQTGVKFEAVRKVYSSEQGDVVAVDDFTLKMCEGEVTSLLGRNGAGKTTLIKMLTGMLAPTSGEICLNGEEGCKPDIGVCPQDNVLIGSLTPREHMVFYAKLKRRRENIDVERSVNEMLASLELGRQEHEPVSRLSGGTKRRLCVALAFLGSPRLVILDEPGAGVDPAARRRIWRLIDQHRIGRTVILSTHHLDEADMLSDTVVIMHRGRILCTGSPLSLKMTYGRGYRLNLSFPSEREDNTEPIDRKKLETLRNVIEEVVPNATMDEISGTEVVVTLPFQGKHGLNNDIAQTARTLEDNRKLLRYSHFSMECDSLERVFLDLCARADNGNPIITASQNSFGSLDQIGLSVPNDDVDLIDVDPTLNPTPIRQAKALLRKRIWHFSRDWMAPVAGLFLPTVFVAVAMGFSLIRPPSEDEPPLRLTPKLYDLRPTYFYSIDNTNDPFLQHVSLQLHDRFGDDYAGAWQTLPNDTGTCGCLDGQQVCHGVSQAVEGLLQILPGRPTLDWIVSTHQEYIEKRYGGWSLSHTGRDPLFVVWYNNKGHHSLPSYLSALNDAILRASGVQGHLKTLNHPLKLSSDQLNRTTLLQHVADVGIALVLLIAFSLVAAQGSKELVRERLSEEKRILYLAGVHPITYWTTALIWDFFVFACSIGLAVIVFEIFGLPAYVARDNLPGVCLLLFLFAWASIPFTHLAEKVFDDPSLSNMVLFCVNTFIGVASLATILVLDILGKTKEAENIRNTLHNFLLIFPQYALGDALVQLSRNDITAELLQKFHMDTYKSPLGWELLGPHYVYLTVIGAVLFLLNLMAECRLLPNLTRQRYAYEVVQEDEDVSCERSRIQGGGASDILQTVRLRKEYRSVYGTNVAVQDLSIGIESGKCFGLLGTNGAGKSTTFKMLTTEVIPTAGRILLKGSEIGSGPLSNGEVGYCPQTDSLDGFLSPHQCLTIHGEVCGLSNVPKAVETTLKRLDLVKYAHRRVDGLSGGNKRKLCTAISVMSPVSVVLMDEPTSGMDPATKDLVAKAIKRATKNQAAVVLTSHSVAECENLCNRVAILARAGLKCIGTPQHLKHKFGEGYVAFLRFSQPVSSADLKRALLKCIPQAVISSRQGTATRLLVPRSQEMPLSTSFSKVKLLAEELKATDYTLTQSSLDQVLVNFSEEFDDEAVDISASGQGSRNSLPNMYSSMDTIHMDTF